MVNGGRAARAVLSTLYDKISPYQACRVSPFLHCPSVKAIAGCRLRRSLTACTDQRSEGWARVQDQAA